MPERRLTLVHNARIHTCEPDRPAAQWFTMLGTKIQRVGSGPPPDAPGKIDCEGKTIVPGFVDAHAHFFQTGMDKLFVDLSGCTTVREMTDRLLAARTGKRAWLFGHSYAEDELSDVDFVTREHLDLVFPDQPVWVNRVDYHSAVVNSVALRRLDIPLGTHGFLMDAGVPNGILRSEAYFFGKVRVSRQYPIETKDRAVRTAAEACLARGITAVHALEGGNIFGEEGASTLLRRMNQIPLDITMFLQEKNAYLTARLGFEHLGGCILIDGSIGSYTAALDEPYENAPTQRGRLYEKPREFNNFVEEAHSLGVQLAFHAIGPRAIGMVLDAYERALHRSPRYDHRHRIEHFELATDDQLKRALDLGVVLSMQPSFEHFWGGPKGMYASRLGERWRRTNRIRTALDMGLRVAGGSDTNVTPADPLLGIHAAVNHPNPEQRVSVDEALRMMTLDAAYAGHNEKRHGSLAAGKEASFVVLDRDLFDVPEAEIKDVGVLETWRLGRQVYRHGVGTLRPPDGFDDSDDEAEPTPRRGEN